jgi:hypothetical protein
MVYGTFRHAVDPTLADVQYRKINLIKMLTNRQYMCVRDFNHENITYTEAQIHVVFDNFFVVPFHSFSLSVCEKPNTKVEKAFGHGCTSFQ